MPDKPLEVHQFIARLKKGPYRKKIKAATKITLYMLNDCVQSVIAERKRKNNRKFTVVRDFPREKLDIWDHAQLNEGEKIPTSYEIRITTMPLSYDIYTYEET